MIMETILFSSENGGIHIYSDENLFDSEYADYVELQVSTDRPDYNVVMFGMHFTHSTRKKM